MLCRLFKLLQRRIALIAGSHQLLTGLTEPLLPKGVARRRRCLELVLALDQRIALEFEVAQQLRLLIGRGQQIQPAPDLGRGERRPHVLDFLRQLGAIAIAGLVVLELGDGRLGLRHLFVIGADLRFELRLPLLVVGLLQFAVAGHRRIRACRRLERPLGEFRLGARDLRVEASKLQVEGRNIGGGKGRVERRQDVAGLDPLSLAHLERLDDRRIERLDDDRRLHRNDLTLAGDHAIELSEGRGADQAEHHYGQNPERRAYAPRLRSREDLGRL